MKKDLLKVFVAAMLISLISASVSWAEEGINCELALAPGSFYAVDAFKGYVSLSTGNEIFVRVQKPRLGFVRGWYFMIHGLMDSHRAYDVIADRLLRRGYGVVRMDLRGFARSLHREYKQIESQGGYFVPPEIIGYQEQVADLKELLKLVRDRFDVKRPNLVGHSMGGGLVMALLADPEATELVGSRAVLIAPYVYRLDYFLAEKFTPLSFSTGIPMADFDAWMPEVMKMRREFVMDVMVSNTQMRIQFGEFFDQFADRRLPQIPASELYRIKSLHVDAAIAAVKGLRDLNSINLAAKVPDHILIDLIYGEEDLLVDASLAKKMAKALESRGGQSFAIQTGHFILDSAPADVLRILTRSQ